MIISLPHSTKQVNNNNYFCLVPNVRSSKMVYSRSVKSQGRTNFQFAVRQKAGILFEGTLKDVHVLTLASTGECSY